MSSSQLCHFSFCEVQVLLLILIWVDSDTFAVVVKGSSDICSDVRQFGANKRNSQYRMDVIMTNWKYLFAYQGIILNLSAGKIILVHQNRHFFALLDRREVGIIMRRDLLVIGSFSTTQIKSLSSCTIYHCLVRTRINELVAFLVLMPRVVIK